MNSIIYEMNEFLNPVALLKDSLLIFAIDDEERSLYALNRFVETKSKGKAALVFAYSNDCEMFLKKLTSIIDPESIYVIDGFPSSQVEFIRQIKSCKMLQDIKKIVIDISCIITPYMFLLIKSIKIWNNTSQLYAINTLPFDYTYFKSPFTSHKSYYGNLQMEEILGFSSSKGLYQEKDLFIFAGFEGVLALKVKEDIDYENLFFVNALPSYHQKYKDISMINNYQLLLSEQCKKLFAPASNPFEVYNLLDRTIASEKYVSIAPLSTKPIALGICMYALKHENVRIIYPFSEKYEQEKSHKVFKSYVYKVS